MQKARVTVTVRSEVLAKAEHQVKKGRAKSVSAWSTRRWKRKPARRPRCPARADEVRRQACQRQGGSVGTRRPRALVFDAGALIAFERNDARSRTLVESADHRRSSVVCAGRRGRSGVAGRQTTGSARSFAGVGAIEGSGARPRRSPRRRRVVRQKRDTRRGRCQCRAARLPVTTPRSHERSRGPAPYRPESGTGEVLTLAVHGPRRYGGFAPQSRRRTHGLRGRRDAASSGFRRHSSRQCVAPLRLA